MAANVRNYGQLALAGLSLLADILGVLAFLGVTATDTSKLWIGISCFLLAATFAALGLFTSIKLWLTPQGSYHSGSSHFARIGSALVAAAVAIAFGFYVSNEISSLENAPGSKSSSTK